MTLFDEIYKDQEILKDYRKDNVNEEEKETTEESKTQTEYNKERKKVITLLDTIISTLDINYFFLGKVYIYISDENIKIKHKDKLYYSEPGDNGLDKNVIINYLKNVKRMVLDDSININRLKIKIRLNYDIKNSYIGKGRIL